MFVYKQIRMRTFPLERAFQSKYTLKSYKAKSNKHQNRHYKNIWNFRTTGTLITSPLHVIDMQYLIQWKLTHMTVICSISMSLNLIKRAYNRTSFCSLTQRIKREREIIGVMTQTQVIVVCSANGPRSLHTICIKMHYEGIRAAWVWQF